MNKSFSAIRCPNNRPHNKYNLCGKILGIIRDKKIYLYCTECKQFFEILIKDNDNVEMIPVSKNIRLKLRTSIRAI